MDGSAKGGFGRAAFGKLLQNALQFTDSVGIVDVLDRGQRFVIGQDGLDWREAHEAAFESVEGNFALRLKQFCQAAPIGEWFGLEGLRNALVQPLWTSSRRNLINKGVSQFMLQDVRQLRRNRTHALDRNA